MKKRILVLVLLFILTLALFACGDDSSSQNECEHVWGKWIGTSEGHYHVCAKCGEQSKVFNHNCDDANDIVNGDYVADCKVCNYKVHTPVYPAIEVADETQNATYLAEINEALNALDEMGESCDISASMHMYLNQSLLSSLNFSCKNSDDLYFVLKGNSTVIYHEEDGKIFSYTESSSYDYERKYVCDVDDFLISSEAFGSVDVEESIELDTTKCNITKYGNTYTIEAYATDMMGEEITLQLVEVYQQLGLDSSILSKITVKTTLELTDTGYSETIEMNMVMAVEGQIVEMPFKVKTSIDYSEIEKIDFLGGEYKISPPSCFEEVYKTTDVTQTFNANGGYYLVQLQKGQYYVLYQNDPAYFEKNTYTTGYNTTHVYDLNGNEIKSDLDSNESRFYNYNIIIPSDGLYYVYFYTGIENDIVTLVKCDYETIYDVDNPKTFGLNTSGVIEGLYDIENYVFISEHDETLLIKNTSVVELIIVVNGEECTLKCGEDKLVSIKKGKNEIIITSKNLTEKTNYSLECTEYYEPKGLDLDNLEVLSEDWSSDYLLALGIGKRFFKLHVEEKGYYSLDVQVSDVYGNSSVHHAETGFYDGSDYLFSNGEILEPGDYIVWVGVVRYSWVVEKVNVKYTFQSLEDYESNAR